MSYWVAASFFRLIPWSILDVQPFRGGPNFTCHIAAAVFKRDAANNLSESKNILSSRSLFSPLRLRSTFLSFAKVRSTCDVVVPFQAPNLIRTGAKHSTGWFCLVRAVLRTASLQASKEDMPVTVAWWTAIGRKSQYWSLKEARSTPKHWQSRDAPASKTEIRSEASRLHSRAFTETSKIAIEDSNVKAGYSASTVSATNATQHFISCKHSWTKAAVTRGPPKVLGSPATMNAIGFSRVLMTKAV